MPALSKTAALPQQPPMAQKCPHCFSLQQRLFTGQPVGSFTFTRLNYANLHLAKSVSPTTPVSYQGQITYTPGIK
ncbi:MAG: hypothetical protein HS114_01725 [Anaerolineales bacterium]|nr:hypothetical protein [Anaerolineales bacterium]